MSIENRGRQRRLSPAWIQSAWVAVLALGAFVVPMSSSGAWILLAPASILLCFFAGRHLVSLAHGLIPLAAGAAAATVVLWFSAQLSVLGFLLNLLTAVVLFVFLPWFIGRSRRTAVLFRQQEREQLVIEAGLRERSRIAAQMHDELGHDLALLALQASALQVSAEPGSAAAAQADAIRAQSDAAIENLHQIIGVLRQPNDPPPLAPSGGDLRKLVATSRAKGMRITVTGAQHLDPGMVPDACADLMHQLAREALTNAARYAPQSAVRIGISRAQAGLSLMVQTRMPSPRPEERDGATGLAGLRTLFETVQGTLSVERTAEHFRVTGWLPADTSGASAIQREVSSGKSTRRARHRVLTLVVPLLILVAAFVGFYALQNATYKATALSPEDFSNLSVGMDRSEVDRFVIAPGLDKPIPIIPQTTAPRDSTCRYFAARTGPLDLTNEMFRLCFADNVLVSAEHLYPLGAN